MHHNTFLVHLTMMLSHNNQKNIVKTKQWYDFASRRKERERRGSNPMQRCIKLLSWQEDEEKENTRCCLLVTWSPHEDKLFGLIKRGRNRKKKTQGSSEDIGVTIHPCKFKQVAPLKNVHMTYPSVLHFCNFLKLSCHKLCGSIYCTTIVFHNCCKLCGSIHTAIIKETNIQNHGTFSWSANLMIKIQSK